MGSASYSNFQVPNTPGLPAGAPTAARGNPSRVAGELSIRPTLNENQNEQNYYGVVTYQKSAGDLNFQVSVFGRNSGVHFTPDHVGDLYFNGVASDVDRNLYSGGLQADASYELDDKHTIRGGVMVLDEYLSGRFDHDGVSGGRQTGESDRRADYPIVENDVCTACLPACICRMNGKSCRSSPSITARALTFLFLV